MLKSDEGTSNFSEISRERSVWWKLLIWKISEDHSRAVRERSVTVDSALKIFRVKY